MINIEKKKYDFIFVILVYRNAEDLFDFDLGLKRNLKNYKVIVVNSFMDDTSEKRIEYIANRLNYDFISVKNKGYGYGNNRGIEYVNSKYNYDYLVLCNADIIIRSFDKSKLPTQNSIIGPKIKTINGKSQNPYWAIENSPMEKMIYHGHVQKSRLKMFFAQGLNKIIRELFLIFKGKIQLTEVYGVHGSCVIFTRDVIKRINPIYDEKMFLYYEEAFLAKRAKKEYIKNYYYPLIEVLHKEDGSTKGMKFDQINHSSSSYIYYYENYVLRPERER